MEGRRDGKESALARFAAQLAVADDVVACWCKSTGSDCAFIGMIVVKYGSRDRTNSDLSRLTVGTTSSFQSSSVAGM